MKKLEVLRAREAREIVEHHVRSTPVGAVSSSMLLPGVNALFQIADDVLYLGES